MLRLPQVTHRPIGGREPVPFASASQAWLWTMAALIARRAGAGLVTGDHLPRHCEPDDIVNLLDRLYRQRRITLDHARILRRWGEQGQSPNPQRAADADDLVIWRQAIAMMEPHMRSMGILRPRRPRTVEEFLRDEGALA